MSLDDSILANYNLDIVFICNFSKFNVVSKIYDESDCVTSVPPPVHFVFGGRGCYEVRDRILQIPFRDAILLAT